MRSTTTVRVALRLVSFVAIVSSEASGAARDLIAASALFAEPTLRLVEMNPAGTHIAAHAVHSGAHGILVQEVETGAVEPVFRTEDPIVFGWLDNDTLIVVAAGERRLRTYLLELTQQEYWLDFEEVEIRARGWPLFKSLLASNDDQLLWSTREGGDTCVYRVPTSELVDPQERNRLPDRDHRVACTSGRVTDWVSDRNGVVRAALAVEDPDDPEWVLRYRAKAGDKWRELARWDDVDDVAEPVGLASNDHDLLVLSRQQRDKRALVEYLIDDRELGKLVYAHPNVDVVGVLYDYNGSEVQAAVYEQGGLRRYHHLSEFGLRQQQWLDESYPAQSVAVTSLTSDRRWLTVLVTGPRNPGNYYVVNTEDRRSIDVGNTPGEHASRW